LRNEYSKLEKIESRYSFLGKRGTEKELKDIDAGKQAEYKSTVDWNNMILQANQNLWEEQKRNREKQLADEQEFREKSIQALEDYLKTVNEKRDRALDTEIDNSKRHQELLREMAVRGAEDAKDNLAYEEMNQAKLEAKKEKMKQRERQFEMGLAVLKSYSKNLESAGGDSTKALTQTIKDATILAAFIKALPAFAKGTEDTGEFDRTGKMAVIHPHERIIPEDQNKLMAGLTNMELMSAALIYKKGGGQWQTNEQVLKKFDELSEVIKNKPALTGSEYDGVTNSIITIIEKGNSIIKNHKRLSKIG
ncbi:MAG: hypothetical protein V1904_08090, partial [Bacteroidota bacterium]